MMAAAHPRDRLAEKYGVGVGLVSDPTHLGAIGRYAQWIAERGHAAMVIVAGLPFMGYHGAKVASIATSPIAIGIPAPGPEDAIRCCSTWRPASPRPAASARPRRKASRCPRALASTPTASPPPTAQGRDRAAARRAEGLGPVADVRMPRPASSPARRSSRRAAARGRHQGADPERCHGVLITSTKLPCDWRLSPRRRTADEAVKALPRREGFDELLLPGERGDREASAANAIHCQSSFGPSWAILRKSSAFWDSDPREVNDLSDSEGSGLLGGYAPQSSRASCSSDVEIVPSVSKRSFFEVTAQFCNDKTGRRIVTIQIAGLAAVALATAAGYHPGRPRADLSEQAADQDDRPDLARLSNGCDRANDGTGVAGAARPERRSSSIARAPTWSSAARMRQVAAGRLHAVCGEPRHDVVQSLYDN